MDITVFLGAPGSGKGTQAKRLSETKKFSHFSTGDMLRSAIKGGRPVGIKAKSFMDKGELVPDSIMIELIEDSLSGLGSESRALLDGFPRTVPQAKALDSNAKTNVARAISFIIPEEVLIRRLTGRRVCGQCTESFHLEFVPPKKDGICDKCGGALSQRPDDNESVVTRRLQVFHSQNSMLLQYYMEAGKLFEIDANRDVEMIQKNLFGLL